MLPGIPHDSAVVERIASKAVVHPLACISEHEGTRSRDYDSCGEVLDTTSPSNVLCSAHWPSEPGKPTHAGPLEKARCR